MSATEIEELCAEINDLIKGRRIDTVITALLVCLGFAFKQGALNIDQAHRIIEEVHSNSSVISDGKVSIH